MVYLVLFVVCGVFWSVSAQNVGDSCVDSYTNTVGKCMPASQCHSAREDFQQNGIRPTFCAYTFEGASVCCRDGATILQTAPPRADNRPVWSNSAANSDNGDRRRVSERKCAEYSAAVTQSVEFLPLLPDAEPLSLSTASCRRAGLELVVGGENAELGEFPHMAAIGWSNFEGGYTFSCGGALISPQWVLTAGHCTRDPNARDPSPVIVRLGDHNINPAVQDGASPVDIPIKSIKKHPEYKPPKRYNDIALLQLLSGATLSGSVRPACLASPPHTPPGGRPAPRTALATGWGTTSPNNPKTSEELQKVSLTLLDNEQCDKLLASYRNRNWQGFAPTQLCAGELRGGKDTCQGDSGSPLQVTSQDNQCIFHVVGVTSFGARCAARALPAVYTRVAAYLDWIEATVWPGE